MINRVQFSGRFSQVMTYCLGMDAVQIPGGIETGTLEGIKEEVVRTFPLVTLKGDVFGRPVQLETSGPTEQVDLADQFLIRKLDAQGAHYLYEHDGNN